MVLSEREGMMYMLREATALQTPVFLSALIKSAVSSFNQAFPLKTALYNCYSTYFHLESFVVQRFI